MENNSASLDKWRIYFKTANADIFGIIEHAIMVAALDFPNELKQKRASIAEMLFTCRVTKCFGCNNVELALPNVYRDEVEAKCHGKTNDRVEMELNANHGGGGSNCSFEDAAEALSDEIDQDCQTIAEVTRIKQIIDKHGQESESSVIDSLRRLQLMALSIETLKITDIGKSVSALRKHESKQIKQLVQALIDSWKAKVEEWVQAKEAIAGTESTPESEKASAAVEEEEEGLVSPPLDWGFLITSNPMELSQFFDDMDFDGNVQNSGEFKKNNENGRKKQEALMKKPLVAAPQEAIVEKPIMASPQDWVTKQPKEQQAEVKKPIMTAPRDSFTKQPKEVKKASNAAEDWYTPQPKEQETTKKKSLSMKPNKASGSGRLRKPTIDKRHSVSQQNKLKSPDEVSFQATLEVAKRKLQERRHQADGDAKKQRTNQCVETPNIHKNHSKQWTNGSR